MRLHAAAIASPWKYCCGPSLDTALHTWCHHSPDRDITSCPLIISLGSHLQQANTEYRPMYCATPDPTPLMLCLPPEPRVCTPHQAT